MWGCRDMEELSRIEEAVYSIENIINQSDMKATDRLSLIYTASQIIKDALKNYVDALPPKNEYVAGFRQGGR